MTYVIVNSVDLNQECIDESQETSLTSVRKSLDGTKAILKYRGDQPPTLTGQTEYTKAEIKVIVANSDWQEEPS